MILHPCVSDIADRLARINKALKSGRLTGADGGYLGERWATRYKDNGLLLGKLDAAEVDDDQDDYIPFTISTQDEDRDGDICVSLGCQIEDFSRNPVVFFSHQAWEVPIGVSRSPDGRVTVFPEENRIRAWWYPDKADPDAMFIAGKVRRKILSAASQAFVPIEAYRRDREEKDFDYFDRAHTHSSPAAPLGWIFKRYSLTEWSIVGVPSCAGAIRDSLDKEKSFISPRLQKALRPYCATAKGCWGGWCPAPPSEEKQVEKEVSNKDVVVSRVQNGWQLFYAPSGGMGDVGRSQSVTETVFTSPDSAARWAKIQGYNVLAKSVKKYITHDGSKWVVHAESGKVLGTHATKEDAERQLRAVEANKHKSTESLQRSAVMRKRAASKGAVAKGFYVKRTRLRDTSQDSAMFGGDKTGTVACSRTFPTEREARREADAWNNTDGEWRAEVIQGVAPKSLKSVSKGVGQKGGKFQVGQYVEIAGNYGAGKIVDEERTNAGWRYLISIDQPSLHAGEQSWTSEHMIRPTSLKPKSLRSKSSCRCAACEVKKEEDPIDKAESDGYRAGALGRPVSDCPYKSGALRVAWIRGWKEATRGMKSKKALNEGSATAGGYTIAQTDASAGTCPDCLGTGNCATCGGTGEYEGQPCAGCGGSGNCAACAGVGDMKSKSVKKSSGKIYVAPQKVAEFRNQARQLGLKVTWVGDHGQGTAATQVWQVEGDQFDVQEIAERYGKSFKRINNKREGSPAMSARASKKTAAKTAKRQRKVTKAAEDIEEAGDHDEEQKEEAAPFEPKHSATVLASLYSHAKSESDYLDGELAKMDNPLARKDLEKYKSEIDERMAQHKEMFEKHHPDADLEEHVKALETDGGGNVETGEENKVEHGEVPPEDEAPAEVEGAEAYEGEETPDEEALEDEDEAKDLEGDHHTAEDDDQPHGQDQGKGVDDEELKGKDEEDKDLETEAGDHEKEEANPDTEEILERYRHPKSGRWMTRKHRVRRAEDGKAYLVKADSAAAAPQRARKDLTDMGNPAELAPGEHGPGEGQIIKEFGDEHHETVGKAADHMEALAEAPDLPAHHAAGLLHHAAALKAMCKDLTDEGKVEEDGGAGSAMADEGNPAELKNIENGEEEDKAVGEDDSKDPSRKPVKVVQRTGQWVVVDGQGRIVLSVGSKEEGDAYLNQHKSAKKSKPVSSAVASEFASLMRRFTQVTGINGSN